MFDLNEYIKYQTRCTKINYGRLSWIWSGGAALLKLERDGPNLVDGILILNFGITTTGVPGTISILDVVTTQEVYRCSNSSIQNLVSPFLYFVKGNQLEFLASTACEYGFNYITIQGDK